MNSFNFQIVIVANLAAITTPFPDHICYFTQNTENYYIWENDALKEIFVDASSITWNNITNKPTTITGYGITDAVKVNSGTLNYVAKFTPNGTTIGNSIIQDDDIRVGINATPSSDAMLTVSANSSFGNSEDFAIRASNIPFGGSMSGIGGIAVNALNALGNTTGISVSSSASFNNTATGIHVVASDATNKYALQLQDGTEVLAGRYLRNMTTDGKANWAKINITEVTNGLSSTLLGAPNGIATLDSNSKLVMSQMPISVMDYKGTYDIVTNTPNLVDGTGNQGDVYVCTTAGTRTFGVGNTLTVSVGDWLIYNGTKWEKTLGNNVGSGTVTSVGLSLGTTGTDVNISNSPITSSGNINLNIPTASASARGLLSISDWNLFNSKVSASLPTNNFVARFVGANLIGNGCIQDIGTNVSVGNAIPSTSIKLLVINNGAEDAIKGYTNASGKIGVYGVNDGSNAGTNTGVQGDASSSTTLNIGVKGNGSSITGSGYGVYGVCTGTGVSVGICGEASSGTSKYAIQLKDGTETVAGRFLKNMTTDGKANWVNITAADVSGAVGAVNGENNYVAKFTPNGTTIGKSLIQDNGTSVGVNMAPNANAMFFVTGGTQTQTIAAQSNVNNGTAIYGQAFTGTGTLYGVTGYANSSTSTNNIGLYGKAINAASNYPIQLEESISSTGKFLKSVTSDGKANWAYLPDTAQLMCSDMTTPITASTALAKSFWIAPCNGQLTDIFANLYSPQAGGAAFSVSIKMNGTTIASPSFTAGAQQSSIIPVSNTFTKGTLFEVFVTQVGDGSAKGLLATINYLRT